MRSVAKNKEEVVSEYKIKNNNEECVYFLFLDGELIYIGKTTDIDASISFHKKHKRFNAVRLIKKSQVKLSMFDNAMGTRFEKKKKFL